LKSGGVTNSERFLAFLEYQSMVLDPIRNLEIDKMTINDTILTGKSKVAMNSLMAVVTPQEMLVFVLYSRIVPGIVCDVLLVDDPLFKPKTLIQLTLAEESTDSESSDEELCPQMGEILVNDDGTVERSPDAPPVTACDKPKPKSVMSCTLNGTGEVKSQGTMSLGNNQSKLSLGQNTPTTIGPTGIHSAPDQASGYTGRSVSGHAPGFVFN
jgi:hypothetical protein